MMKVSRLDTIAEKQAERASLKEIVNDTKDIEAIRAKHRVTDYNQFKDYQKHYWRLIGGMYPGVQVYACGSRVRGDYIEPGQTEYFQIKDARMRAGMAPKRESDYDYWIPPEIETVTSRYSNFDRVRVRIPENEKIPIPMWDFSKLPESEHENVKAFLLANDIQSLVKIHDRYSLSPHSYCCSGVEGVKAWFEWAIKEGHIK